MELLPEFDVEDYKEIIDNSPLLYIIIFSIIFAVTGILLNLSMMNTFEVITIILFLFMIFGSITIFTLSGVVTDWKERKDVITYILMTMVGLTLILVSAVVVGLIRFQTFTFVLWKPYVTEFPIEPQLYTPLAPVYINFMSLSQALRIDPNVLYDVGKYFLLVAPGEELVFRGIMPFLLAKLVKTPWVGGMISNAFWASLHTIMTYAGPELLTWTLIAYVGGFWLLYIMVQSMDITTPILVHAVYNTIVRLMGAR